jgi:glutaredoxin-like protein NrdH
MDKYRISYETVDLSQDKDAHAYVTGLGYTAAPVVVVDDGQESWAGFRAERIKALVD